MKEIVKYIDNLIFRKKIQICLKHTDSICYTITKDYILVITSHSPECNSSILSVFHVPYVWSEIYIYPIYRIGLNDSLESILKDIGEEGDITYLLNNMHISYDKFLNAYTDFVHNHTKMNDITHEIFY